jgi:DNA-binding NarL/FixJ family response regulator
LSKKTILVVEDHPLYRQALSNLIKVSLPEVELLSANSAEEALTILSKKAKKDLADWIILLDLSLPGLSGLSAVHAFAEAAPTSSLVVISATDDKLQVSACIGSGAVAFISKSTPPDRVTEFLGRLLREKLAHPELITNEGSENIANLKPIRLTPRQIEVLLLIFQGKSNRDIAETLDIIEATAKAHVSAIFRELDVVNRTQALLAAQKLGFKANSKV